MPHYWLIFNLFFFLFELFFSLFSKKKKKILIFSLLVHIYCYTSSNLSPPSLPLYLPITLYFTIKLFSSFPFSFISIFLLPILFYINLISFLLFNSFFFFHKKTLSTLSLSLSLSLSMCGFFFLSYNSNLGWFFFLICVLVLRFFNFTSQVNPSNSFGWILVWVNFWK